MEPIKWMFYRLLVRFIGQQRTTTPIHMPTGVQKDTSVYYVFCSTIGELNGCRPLISKLDELGQLVLLTDRDCYQEAFQKQYPNAIIVEIQGWHGEARELIAQFTPEQFFLCEIPCLPNDAPCRLSYDFLRTLRQANVALYAVNGWLYEYAPSCRQDAIERKLFTKEYLRTFNTMMVQNQAVKDKLVTAGQCPDRIKVTGNMKFDAVNNTNLVFKDSDAEELVAQIAYQNRTTIVAGSLSDRAEYAMVVNAFCQFRGKQKDAFMVLAPRHPEKQEQIAQIKAVIADRGLTAMCRSDVTQTLPPNLDILILDTFGELQGMYYACDLAYIGKNHNILEPLAFGKPVAILGGWESTYPSYPVYEICKKAGLVFELDEADELGETFAQLSDLDADKFSVNISAKLKVLGTALDKNLAILSLS